MDGDRRNSSASIGDDPGSGSDFFPSRLKIESDPRARFKPRRSREFRASHGLEGLEPRTLMSVTAGGGDSAKAAIFPFPYAGGENPIAFRGSAYFAASTPGQGMELWRSDGTSGGTRVVQDINPGSNDAGPSEPTIAGDQLFFVADDGKTGRELWATDGQSARLVRDIRAGSQGSNPYQLVSVGGSLYFLANNSAGRSELWRSDGAEGGTVQIAPSSGGAVGQLDRLIAAGDRLFALSSNPNPNPNPDQAGVTLNAFDPSTGQFRAVRGFSGEKGGWIGETAALGDRLFFLVTQADGGSELWRTDGAAAGTVRVADFSKGNSSYIHHFTVVGDRLYFAVDGATNALWSSDGTAPGTSSVFVAGAGDAAPRISDLRAVGSRLFLATHDGEGRSTIWVKNPGAGAPVKAAQTEPGHYLRFLAADGDGLLFHATHPDGSQSIRRTDGTPEGTSELPGFQGVEGSAAGTIAVNGKRLALIRKPTSATTELWAADASSPGSQAEKLTEFKPGGAPSSQPMNLTILDGVAYFTAYEPTRGYELWRSDGTAAGTQPVADIRPGSGDSSPSAPVKLGDKLIFTADDGVHGSELRTVDAKGASTILKDIRSGADSSFPYGLVVVNGQVYFVADDGEHGSELWRTDGTEAGTRMVRDLRPGADSPFPRELTALGDRLLFVADDGKSGEEVWTVDAEHPDGHIAKEIRPGSEGALLGSLTTAPGAGAVYFAADDGKTGRELWRTDGTASGTWQAADVGGARDDQGPIFIAPWGQGVVFATGGLGYSIASASSEGPSGDGTQGPKLWRSNGSPGDVQAISVPDISYPSQAVTVGDALFLAAQDSNGKGRLWRLSADSSTATRVDGVNSAADWPWIGSLAAVGDQVFFTYDDGEHGTELWRVDRSGSGADLVADINPDANSSFPNELKALNGSLLFTATDRDRGQELWRSDGTAGGTAIVGDINTVSNPDYGPIMPYLSIARGLEGGSGPMPVNDRGVPIAVKGPMGGPSRGQAEPAIPVSRPNISTPPAKPSKPAKPQPSAPTPTPTPAPSDGASGSGQTIRITEGQVLRLATRNGPNAEAAGTTRLGPRSSARGVKLNRDTGVATWTATDGPSRRVIEVVTRTGPRKGQAMVKRFDVMVENANPVVELGDTATVGLGQTLTRVGRFSDPGADRWTATVDYGDGQGPRPLSLRANKTFTVAATVDQPGERLITVVVRDEDGGAGEAQLIVKANENAAVQDVRFWDGAPMTAQITFGSRIAVRNGAFVFRNAQGRVLPSRYETHEEGGRTVVSLTLGENAGRNAALPSGTYTLTLNADRLIDENGQALDGDGDGRPGGDRVLAHSHSNRPDTVTL